MSLEETWITIPVGSRETYLPGVLDSLSYFHNRIVFVNNKHNYTTYPGVHHLEDFSDINIYKWWNMGINFAQEHGAKYVCVLNDDLKFDSSFVPSLLDFLINNKLAIADTDRSNNGGGAAWILDLSYDLRLDESFKWWYGDTELFDRAKKINKFAKFVYQNFEHIAPNNNLESNQELQLYVAEDEKLYNEIRSNRGY